jgi:hypothetical protein
MLGRPLWFELMTTDVEAARRFYGGVVGWTTKDSTDLGMAYTEWLRPDGAPAGGMMALPAELKAEGVPPHWIVYIGVDRLEERAAHVARLGGGSLSPVIEVPTVGRLQTMRDGQGAAFSLYEPSSEPPTEAPPVHGDLSWLELYTTDSAAALAFYRELFGWQSTEDMDMGPMGVYRMFGRTPNQAIGGMMTKTPDMQMPNAWTLYFKVPDVHAAAERVKANGGQILHGPMEVPGGDWIVQAMDPQGAAFALHQAK